jgi:FkbM family methyltransferase
MNIELLLRPRLLFTKILKRYCRPRYSPRLLYLLRDKLRKYCVAEEIKVHTKANFWMYVSPRDYATYGIYFFGIYDEAMTSIFTHLIKPGETVWDVGTERGWFTLHMANLVGKDGRVDSFEAFPPTVEKLKRNVAANNMTWVNVNGVAVSDSNSKMWFIPPSNDVTGNDSRFDDHSGVGYLTGEHKPGAIEVNTLRLDDYYIEQKIQKVSLIKMDIEGAEVSALKGAKNLILKDKPIIAIEFNRLTALRANSSVEELRDLLVSYGYQLFLFDRKFTPFDLADHKDEDLVINVYCFPN